MSGNGVRTGINRDIQQASRLILKDLQAVGSGSCGAVHGTTLLGTAVPLLATGADRSARTAAAGFVSFGLLKSSCRFLHFAI